MGLVDSVGGPVGGELGWGEVAVGGVGPVLVVVDAPVFDEDSGLEQRLEHPQVQQFVTEPGVERLDPRVLPRRARIDEHSLDTGLGAPFGHDDRDELGAVVEPKERWRSASFEHEPVETATTSSAVIE